MAVGILLVTHPASAAPAGGRHAPAAQPAAGCEAFEVPFDADPDALLPQASAALRRVDGGDGVLVLTDLYGATPSNLAARLSRLGTPVRRVSALSLPMLLRVMNYAELELDGTAGRRRRRRPQRSDPSTTPEPRPEAPDDPPETPHQQSARPARARHRQAGATAVTLPLRRPPWKPRGREVNAKSIMGVMLLAAGPAPRWSCASTARTNRPPPMDAPPRCSSAASTRTADAPPPVRQCRGPRQRTRTGTRAPAARAGCRRNQDHCRRRRCAELERIHEAVDIVRAEMHTLRQRLHGALAHEVGEFLDLHALLLDDPELLQGIDALIRTGLYSADYALRLQRDRIAAVFEGMDDAYLRSRIDDIDQVIGRLHAALHRREADLQGVAGEILVTDSIAPAELAQLQAQGVVGVVTAGGSPLSHSAILARSLHLPLVVGATQALLKVNDGDVLVIDGASGLVVLEPNAADLRAHHKRVIESKRERRELNRLRREPSRTLDGVDIKLWANAESRDDVAEAHALGAAGVGLYRTEFLFMGSSELPDEETQFRAYRDAGARHDRTHRHHPHARPGRGQGRQDRTGPARRTQSRPGPARRAPVAGARRLASHAVAGDGARLRLRPLARAGADGQRAKRCARSAARWMRCCSNCAAKASRSPTTCRWAR
jgi:mannose/fructose-specific phosphotransferase system component IIA/phosphohistidine swiveling domain-containing protein/uncharacterized protein (DUF2267 family)